MSQSIVSSAPGRICLFGEHQDYLGLPVVAMAVDRRFRIEFTPEDRSDFLIQTPDLKDSPPQVLDIHASTPRNAEDFCWGIGQVLLEEGFRFESGGVATFSSNIPFRAGCSSSSAMSAAWMRLLLEIGQHSNKSAYLNDPVRVANLVYKGEKEKFQGSGGMMDQYSCYLGGLIHVYESNYYAGHSEIKDIINQEHSASSTHNYSVENLPTVPDGIILIDSGQPKDTQGILSRVSDSSRSALACLQEHWHDFHLRDTSIAELKQFMQNQPGSTDLQASGSFQESSNKVLQQLHNRELCQEALGYFRDKIPAERMAAMLNEQHQILSDSLGISTPRIEEIRNLVLSSGAAGAKINGSGGGGTLFCYAPGKVAQVSKVLAAESIVHHIVAMDEGARIE